MTVRYFKRALESDLSPLVADGWTEAARDTIPSIPRNPVVLLERDHLAEKNDAGKERFDLIPPEGDRMVAMAFTIGSHEYGDDNYLRLPNGWNRIYAALRRHENARRRGEVIDPKSGLPHLAHVIANAHMLMELDRQAAEE